MEEGKETSGEYKQTKRGMKRKRNSDKGKETQEQPVKAVMFVPYTPGGELAKKLRENEEKLSKLTKNKVKIVERAGVKLQDVITKANPWKGQDCERKNCILCFTKARTGKKSTQDCHKRSIIYETRCLTCEEAENERIESLDIEEKEKKEMKRNMKKYKYIGESSRSAYERGWEHANDMAQLKSTSHMLKHAVGVHPEKDMNEVVFGMSVLKYTQTSFERQIGESVAIQLERKRHHLLNSRSEYNRCSLPRLCTQIGEGEYKEYSKELELEKKEEEKLEAKIRALRKERNKARLHPTKEQGPKSKRRKINETEYIDIKEIWGEPKPTNAEKRKIEKSKLD